jgi:hypothetical protein
MAHLKKKFELIDFFLNLKLYLILLQIILMEIIEL